MMSCSSCRFAQMEVVDDDSDRHGDPVWRCFRYPPTLLFDPSEGEVLSLRPDADEWCGEWTPDQSVPTDDCG